MPLGPSDSRWVQAQRDARRDKVETMIRGGGGSTSGPKTVGIKPKFGGMVYKNGSWQKK